ncbi:MAG: efflux RND transporter periplasmic adaptor subunit [Bacteroidia bacterium]|nr:efflux RND transporter periplasmic adaptor subunit [Bacteroidia bacterium]
MKNLNLTIIIIIAFVFAFSSCTKKNNTADTATQENANEHKHEESSKTTTLNEEQLKSLGVEFGILEKKQLTTTLKANGLLKVPNQNRATVTTTNGGIIKSIFIQPGNTVQKGQILATLYNNSFIILQEEYLSTLAKEELARNEYERQKVLKENNASSQKVFQQAEAELKSLRAKKASLQRQLELIGINTSSLNVDNLQTIINITSPITGSVSEVKVNIGTYVDAFNPIAQIVDNSQLHLDLFVYEKDLKKLEVGQIIHFTLTNNPGKEYDAKIFGISNTFEENTKAIAVHASVLGDKIGLIDGMGITAIVSLQNALMDAVPTEAIVNYQGSDYIIIEKESNNEHIHSEKEHVHETTFEKIQVKKGTSDIGFTEITLLKDISPNAKIVTNGAFFILAKMTNSGEQGHEH